MVRVIFFDTETTGVDTQNDQIVEIAAYEPATGAQFVSLVKPSKPIPKAASDITGIDDAMVKDAPPFSEVGEAFRAFCGEGSLLVAHNGDRFDAPLLCAEYARHNLNPLTFSLLDTLHLARKFRPDLPRHSLQYLREVYEIPANSAHRAMDDVVVLAELFSRMTEDLSIEEVVLLLAEEKGSGQTMPFGKYRGRPLSEVPKDYFSWLASSGALDKKENSALKEALIAASLL